MEALLPISGPNPCCSAPPVPTEPCPVCPRLAAEFEPWRQAAYWQSLHQRARAARAAPARKSRCAAGPHSLPGTTPVRPQDRTRRHAARRRIGDPATPTAATSRPTTRTPRTQTPPRHPPAGRRGNPRRAGRPAALPPVRSGVPRFPSLEPTTARSWKSRCRRPIAGSFADDAIGPPVAAAAIPASSPPRRRPSSCPRALRR